MAVADDPLLARLGPEIGMLCEKLSDLRFDRLGSSARAPLRRSSVRESVKAPGWASLITLLSDTAYHSFIGEVEASNTTTIPPLPPSCRHQLLAIALRDPDGSVWLSSVYDPVGIHPDTDLPGFFEGMRQHGDPCKH